MTNKLEISRELAETIISELTSGAVSIGTSGKLRTLLAASDMSDRIKSAVCRECTSHSCICASIANHSEELGVVEPVVSEDELIAAGFGYPMSKEEAVKAYKASLQTRTDHPNNEDCEWCHGCGHDYYGDPCIGCCKPNPDPVYLYRRKGNTEWATCDRPRFVEFSSHKMFNTKICFASPPAPVVIPAYRKPAFYFARVGNTSLAVDLADEWNDCLDKVKELNQ